MPTEKGDKRTLTIWIPKDVVARLDNLARRADISRNKLVMNIINVVVEDLEWARRIGLLALLVVIRNLRESVKQKPKGDQGEPEGRAMTVWLQKDLSARLDKLADEGGLTRSTLVTNMINTVVGDLEKIDRIGFVAVSVFIRDLAEMLKARFQREIEEEGIETK